MTNTDVMGIILLYLPCQVRDFVDYSSFLYHDSPKWKSVPRAEIKQWHWEGKKPFRPSSFAQLCGVYGKGLYAKLWSFEENPRCVYSKRDDPVYRDSCLEFFVQPVPGNPAYLNFEMNAKGVYLSQFGENRMERVFLKDCCKLEPMVSAFDLEENGRAAWGVELFLSEVLISEIYKVQYILKPGTLKGNFYKCGDWTPRVHYGAYFPVSCATLGFHNPSKFGNISLK